MKVLLMDIDDWEVANLIDELETTSTAIHVIQREKIMFLVRSVRSLNGSDEYRSLLQDTKNPKVAWNKLITHFCQILVLE